MELRLFFKSTLVVVCLGFCFFGIIIQAAQNLFQFLMHSENLMKYFALISLIFVFTGNMFAQETATEHADEENKYTIVLQDGTRHVGFIKSDDGRELTIKTETLGIIVIPKYLIEKIEAYSESKEGGTDLFASRYFFTTNGFSLPAGDNYIQWTLFGPDLQFGITESFSAGIMTSWIGIPVIGSVKKTFNIAEDLNFAIGGLAGTNIWEPTSFAAALPYASITRGTPNRNISLSTGYGLFQFNGDFESQILFSVGGLYSRTATGMFVFDSFIVPSNDELVILLIPGYRIQTRERAAWQFGFPGLYISGDNSPFGFPIISWFRKI